MKLKPRPLNAGEVEFNRTFEFDFATPIRGNAMASGDDEADRAYERELEERIDRGDNTAWCCLVVKAEWQGYRGFAYLGGYTFPEGQSGTENAEYAESDFEQLKTEALDDLNASIASTSSTLETLMV